MSVEKPEFAAAAAGFDSVAGSLVVAVQYMGRFLLIVVLVAIVPVVLQGVPC